MASGQNMPRCDLPDLHHLDSCPLEYTRHTLMFGHTCKAVEEAQS